MSWRMLRMLTVVATIALTGCTNRTLMNWGNRDSAAAFSGTDQEREPEATYEKASGLMAAANAASADQLVDQATALSEGASDDDTAKLVEARSLFQAALKQRPDDFAIHHQLAIVSDRLNDFRQAEQHYRAALKKRPRDANLLSDLGFSYFLQERYREAEDQLQKAIRIEPGHKRAATNLGALHAAQGHRDEALSWFERGGTREEAQKNMAVFFKDAADSVGDAADTEALVHNVPPEIRAAEESAPARNLPRIVAGASAGNRMPQNNVDNAFATTASAQSEFGDTNPFEAASSHRDVAENPAAAPAEPNPFEVSASGPAAPQNNPFENSVVNQRPVSHTPPAVANTNRIQPAQFSPARPPKPAGTTNNSAIHVVKPEPRATLDAYPHAPIGDDPVDIVARGRQNVTQANHTTINGVDPASGSIRTAGAESAANPFESAAPQMPPAASLHVSPQAPAQPNPFEQKTPAQPTTSMPAASPDAHAQWVGMNAGPGAMFPYGKARPVVPGSQKSAPSNAELLQSIPSMPNVQQIPGQLGQGVGQIRNAVRTRVENAQGQFEDLIQHGQSVVPTANYSQQVDQTLSTATQTVQQYGQQIQSQAGAAIEPYRKTAGQVLNNVSGQVRQNAGQQMNRGAQQLNGMNNRIQDVSNQVQNAVNDFPLPTITPGLKQR